MSDPKNPDHNESDFIDMDLETSEPKLDLGETVAAEKKSDSPAQDAEFETLFTPGDFVSHHEDSVVEADVSGAVVEEPVVSVAGGDDEGEVYDVAADYPPVSDDTFEQADDAQDADDWDEDFDDEEGIFAASSSEAKKKSSFGILLVSAAALAIVGAGGYFYLNDPDMIQRIQKNFSGEPAANSADNNVLLPSFDLNGQGDTASSGPVANTQSQPQPQQQGSADIFGGDMPPQPPVLDGAAPADMASAMPAPEPMQDQPAPLMGEGESVEGEVIGSTPPPIVPSDVVDAQPIDAPQTDAMDGMPAPEGEMASVPPEVVAPVDAAPTPAMAPVEEPVAEPVPAPAPVVAPVVAQAAPAPVAVPPSDGGKVKLVDDVSAKVPDSKALTEVADAKSPVASEPMKDQLMSEGAETEQKEEKEPVYYDSPGGSMLAALPAPSLNVKRGTNESIIIVKAPVKPKPKPKYNATRSSGKVEFETTSLDARVVAAGRALKLGRYTAAAEMYEDLYKLNPRDPRILMGRAILFQKTGDDRAASAYEELLLVDPGNADAIVNLAGLIRKEYPAVALGKLLDLRQRYPDNPAVAAQLGVAYADSGNLPDAYRYLSLAASMEPNNPLHYFNMAVIADRAHEAPKAIAMYEKALEVDAVHGTGRAIPRDKIYDRLAQLRGR